MMPLCDRCIEDTEVRSVGEVGSRRGESCDNCGEFTSTNATAPGGGLTNREALRDPWLAFILGMATMALVFAVVIFL